MQDVSFLTWKRHKPSLKPFPNKGRFWIYVKGQIYENLNFDGWIKYTRYHINAEYAIKNAIFRILVAALTFFIGTS